MYGSPKTLVWPFQLAIQMSSGAELVAGERLEVADRRARAAVDARDVALRVELAHPPETNVCTVCEQAGLFDRVALHVEVDRAARREAERGRARATASSAAAIPWLAAEGALIFARLCFATHGACSPT